MPIHQPSQYECDNKDENDYIYVKSRSKLYEFLRKHFRKNLKKIKIDVTKEIDTVEHKIEYYQEDLILYRECELRCVQHIEKVPCSLIYGGHKLLNFKLKKVTASLYNVNLVFKNGLSLLLPLSVISSLEKRNEIETNQIESSKLVAEALKYKTYNGDTFKKIVQKRNIKNWNGFYCFLCGKPTKFTFKKDSVCLNNNCKCGNVTVLKKEFSYDDFALWYATQQVNETTKEVYDKFWFNEE